MKIFSRRKLAEALDDPRIRLSGVAKVAGISVQAIYSIRDGRKSPKADTLSAIAYALNKPIDFFYEEEALLAQQTLPLTKEVANG